MEVDGEMLMDEIREQAATIARQAEVIAKCKQALKPFAEAASEWDHEPLELVVELLAYQEGPSPCASVYDFRMARAALAFADGG